MDIWVMIILIISLLLILYLFYKVFFCSTKETYMGKMKVLKRELHIEDDKALLDYAKNLKGEYKEPVTFFAYWNGTLNKKHLHSIKSCYYFNVFNKKNKKIVLWVENNKKNKYNDEISKYSEIKELNFEKEVKDTFMHDIKKYMKNPSLSFYSDIVRYVLLHNYGGCYFGLDIYFLRSFEPLFHSYKNNIMVYQWETQNYPNGAIYISLQPKNKDIESNIKYIIKRNQGFGFQEANLHFDLPLKLLVLPCVWFDPSWSKIDNNIKFSDFFIDTQKKYTFDNFFPGSFCYHWHNKWNDDIGSDSIFEQLNRIIDKELK